MKNTTIQAAQAEVALMRTARDLLARQDCYFTTAEAVLACPMPVSEETLLAYPEWVLPRHTKNPRAKRKTYLWDPRDVLALPMVIRAWERAIRSRSEDAFREQRLAEIEARDLQAFAAAAEREAA